MLDLFNSHNCFGNEEKLVQDEKCLDCDSFVECLKKIIDEIERLWFSYLSMYSKDENEEFELSLLLTLKPVEKIFSSLL